MLKPYYLNAEAWRLISDPFNFYISAAYTCSMKYTPQGMYASEMHVYEVHAHEMHAYEIHDHKIHTHEMHTL
jgi:hypothetical protein